MLTNPSITLGLDRILFLLSILDNPHKQIANSAKIIHITGTNGKGSTAAMLAAQLSRHGLTGVFTSPHMVHPGDSVVFRYENFPTCLSKEEFLTERQRILTLFHNTLFTLHEATSHYTHKKPTNLHWPSEFELLVAIAFNHFARQKIKFLVLEVGMGGARDATNVFSGDRCANLISVLTTVALDHQKYLGNTIEEICREKLGIVSAGGHLVVGDWLHEDCWSEVNAKKLRTQVHVVCEERQKEPPLLGSHQRRNFAIVLKVLEILCVPYSEGVVVHHPARMQRLKLSDGAVEVLIDGCHNEEGIRNLRNNFPADFDCVCWILGFTGDKVDLLKLFPVKQPDLVVCASFQTDREFMPWVEVLDPSILQQAASHHGWRAASAQSVLEAFQLGIQQGFRKFLVCGSLYLCFDFLTALGQPLDHL